MCTEYRMYLPCGNPRDGHWGPGITKDYPALEKCDGYRGIRGNLEVLCSKSFGLRAEVRYIDRDVQRLDRVCRGCGTITRK